MEGILKFRHMYPGTAERPKGKLRLLYECNPFAYIVERAGAKASDGEKVILEETC